MFADGRTVWGQGFGAEGEAVGELCFNTAMTGYQEVMTDPSYAKQVIAFTFPHIGNVGANDEDVEAGEAHALGCLVREVVTEPSQLSRQPGLCRLDGEMGPDRDRRRRYARADQAGADRRAADHRHRASRGRAVRSRRAAADGGGMAGARGHGPGQGGQPAAGRALDRRQMGLGAGVCELGGDDEAARTSSRSIMATSATSSACLSRPGRG